MANGHGGPRAGAGRKPRAERHSRSIVAAEKQIAKRLPDIIDGLFELANGGYERVRQKWEPAGLVMIEDVEETEGDDGKIRRKRIKRPAFPDLDPEEMVLVERTTEIADRDRQALIYLANRVMGTPIQAVEADISTGGQPLSLGLEEAILKVYGAAAESAAAQGAPGEPGEGEGTEATGGD